MTLDPLAVTLTLQDDQVQFTGALRELAPVTIDYTPPVGTGQGYTSLELLLMSLASCSGTSLLLLLRKARKQVDGLTVQATGLRREQHPTGFREITLTFQITSADVTDDDVHTALRISEESICPVWAMLKPSVEIHTAYHLLAPANTQPDLA